MDKINKLIDNEFYPKKNYFSVIIGSSPSKGARSPKLWNVAFEAHDIDCRMYPLDVNEKNFFDLLQELFNHKKFIGGAVTNPYKEKILNYKKISISKTENNIGAINCFYKSGGNFIGVNTDGFAAYETINRNFEGLLGKKILLLGCGGAGKAISSIISEKMKLNNNLIIAVRNIKKIYQHAKNLNAKLINWNDIDAHLSKVSLIINSTDLGGSNFLESSPLSEEKFSKIKPNTNFFDVIYQPEQTKFLNFAKNNGNKFINGSFMNFYQAVLAFNLSNHLKEDNQKTITSMYSII